MTQFNRREIVIAAASALAPSSEVQLDTTMLAKATNATGQLGASLIRDAKNEADAVAIATAFALTAVTIYRQLGGEKLVAEQFYRIADDATNRIK